jgi:sensor c-di-GMP phosphodiesterase-like protein
VRLTAGVAIALAVGTVAVSAPILESVHLARRQSLDEEKTRVQGYAYDLVHRADQAASESFNAAAQLSQAHLQPCSPAEIALMRRIQLESLYLEAVGRVANNALTCTSLGTTEPIPVGPVLYVGNRGGQVRTNVRLPIGGGQSVVVLSKDGFATLIQPMLPFNLSTDGADIGVAIYRPETGVVVGQKGRIRPAWLGALHGAGETSFVDGGYVVVAVQSQNYDYAAVAAAPPVYLERRVREFATAFVPIGLVCGFALAWAVLYVSRVSLSMPRVLRNAVRRNEFFVEYQPIVDLRSGQCVAAEALVRWRRRDGETIAPDMFIPVAEDSGVIQSITECVANIVAADARELLRRDPNFRIGINLSAPDLQSDRTVVMLERMLRISGARAPNIVVEATERGFLHGEAPRQLVGKLRSLGFGVAIDDFGTGYSSLSYLEKLELNYLKIDKLFVDTIGTEGATSQVILHIIEMARSLQLEMIAEGVETEAQMEFLQRHGVHFAQGWLLGKPMPLDALSGLLAQAA